MNRLSTGEIADAEFTRLAFPTGYHYDVLRALDYFRVAGRRDDRQSDALEFVAAKRRSDGRWCPDLVWPDELDIGIGDRVGQPSRWITLRAMRVLRWASDGRPT